MRLDRQQKEQGQEKASEPAAPGHAPTPVVSRSTSQPVWTQAMGNQLPARFQTTLTINQPGDAAEQEADRMAERVTRPPGVEKPGVQGQTTLMRKKSHHAGHPARAGALESTGPVEPAGHTQTTQSAPPVVHTVLNSQRGQPLDAATRASMEPRFGHDFSGVRVHTDEQAAESAQAVRAQAYTVGQDLVFGAGQYAPSTGAGQKLLAHELAHVVQQGMGGFMVQRAPLGGIGYIPPVQLYQALLKGLDIQAIAEQLYTAMKGLGTDEEAIYVGLQKLEKDPAAIAALVATYKSTYNKDLEAEIRSEMSGDELRLALELMGIRDDPKRPWMVDAAPPSTPEQYKAAARKLYAAMKGLGTDEEAIYAVLIPFKHDATALKQLKDTYQVELSGGLTKQGLEADIRDEMSGDELAYALYLLNAPAPAQQKTGVPTIPNEGTEAASGNVGGGRVSVHTGVGFTSRSGHTATSGFSMGYKGGLAADSNWLQFIWREILVTDRAKKERPISDTFQPDAGGAPYNYTTDPSRPVYHVDSADTNNPFYATKLIANRAPGETTIYDDPGPVQTRVTREFRQGATKVSVRTHFDTFLIRDYKTLYRVSLNLVWTFTDPTNPTTFTKTATATSSKVKFLPDEQRETLIAQYPKFDYIQ